MIQLLHLMFLLFTARSLSAMFSIIQSGLHKVWFHLFSSAERKVWWAHKKQLNTCLSDRLCLPSYYVRLGKASQHYLEIRPLTAARGRREGKCDWNRVLAHVRAAVGVGIMKVGNGRYGLLSPMLCEARQASRKLLAFPSMTFFSCPFTVRILS